jgi:hypothetical protein
VEFTVGGCQAGHLAREIASHDESGRGGG